MSNFRPVLNASFISQVIERVVAKQFDEYLTILVTDVLPRYRSTYKKYDSTLTAMLRRDMAEVVMAPDPLVPL